MITKMIQSIGLNRESKLSGEDKLRRDILHHEAKVGGTLFGPVPKGGHREFFCLDEYTWIWYEQWLENGKTKSRTTRYNVMHDGIVKAENDNSYRMVSKQEALRLYEAAQTYKQKVEQEVYRPILKSASKLT